MQSHRRPPTRHRPLSPQRTALEYHLKSTENFCNAAANSNKHHHYITQSNSAFLAIANKMCECCRSPSHQLLHADTHLNTWPHSTHPIKQLGSTVYTTETTYSNILKCAYYNIWWEWCLTITFMEQLPHDGWATKWHLACTKSFAPVILKVYLWGSGLTCRNSGKIGQLNTNLTTFGFC